ncbi:MAG TPA: nodulation protein NfeD [Acidobacteriota bacterium]|nr:nodulation protein NfeD [Acidobacteriota bacterium]
MKIKALPAIAVLLVCGSLQAGEIVRIDLNGVIQPVAAQYVSHGIDHAAERHASLVVVVLETPGGLSESMRTIITKILNSPVPVVVYVGPSGARAASAGFYITVSADVAAMAPGTHLGSAHPVMIPMGSNSEEKDTENTKTEMKKATEDAVAYIKTLAQNRGRNVELAEKAVRDSVSFTETEALKGHLIDFVAADLADVIKKCDGLQIKRFNGATQKLDLAKATVVPFAMSRRERFLSMLADPNIVLILIGIGTIGIMIELYNPGAILPGIVGVLCLALFFISMQILPISATGLALIVFAVLLFILELKVHSHGLLTAGGIVSLALGATMLIDAPIPEMRVARSVIFLIVSLVAATMIFLVTIVIIEHRKRPTTGIQGLLQEIGTAQTDIDPEGRIFVHGEIWRAVSNEKIQKGDRVRILSADGLTLQVQRYNSNDRPL